MTYPNFPKECNSLLSKHLTKEVFEALKKRKTSNGFRLEQAIRSGVENLDSGIGVYAGDEASYREFSELFDPIIQEYHGFTPSQNHKSSFNLSKLEVKELDPNGDYILSTRIRVGRNLKGFPLGTIISKEQRSEVEVLVVKVLESLEGELAGEYYALEGMSNKVQKELIEAHFLFKEGDRFLESAGLNRDWASARGIFHNHNKTFLVWLNEEDQLRIISMQKGGNILEVALRLKKALEVMEKKLTFAYSEHLGYISSCPTNLGTAMRASVHIKLPKLAQKMEQFEAITKKHHLQIRGIDGEHSQSKGAIFDISNRRRLGISEVEAIEDLMSGVEELIEVEKSLTLRNL